MKKSYPLTIPQESIWLTDKFYEYTSISNLGGTLLIKEKVDFDLLNKSINLFIEQNDGIRLSFNFENGSLYQFVKDYSFENFPVFDVNSDEELHNLEKSFMHERFTISNLPLYRFNLIKLKNGFGGFNIIMHHLISDAWSMSLLVTKIIDIYSCLLKNQTISVENAPSYIDYIESEQKYLESEKFRKDKLFWEDKFNTCPSCTSFSQKNSQNASQKAKRKIFSLDNSSKIVEFCKNTDLSVFTFLMTVFSIYLYRISGVEDIIIGSPILNRNGLKEKNMMGLFINTLPVKIEIHDNPSFSALAKHVSDTQFSMFRHHKFPYSRILEFVRDKYKFSNNLYDTIISYQNARDNSDTSDVKYTTNWDFNGAISNSLDIHIYDLDNTGILKLFYDYRLDKFSEDDITDIHNRILYIIDQIISNPDILVNDLEIVTPEEKNILLYDFNDTSLDYPKSKTINELFEEQVLATPEKIAVAFGDSTLTYYELNKKANQLANFLRKEKNIKSNTFVGILTKRSLEMAVGILAILKAGATYVPIDPEYPEDRVSYMIEDSGAKLILVDNYTQDLYKLKNVVNIDLSNEFYNNYSDENLPVLNTPDDLMYLIYTSGSTGKPKGVMLMHKNVNNYLHGLKYKIDFFSEKVIVSVTTICFDIFVTEFWGGLLNGLTVVIANEQEQNIASDLSKLCSKYNVNMIQTTPSRFTALLAENSDFLNTITDLMVGGEALPKTLLKQLHNFPWIKIFNMYGPTETAVWSTIKESPVEENITIGTPIANTVVYILDDNLKLLPPNIPGNLYIGGDGVCKGYYNRTDLTKNVFVKSPFDDSIIYNTKDLAYIQKDGEIVHLGRSDFQAKVHGFRVELGEIENAIMTFPDITNAVVLLQDNSLNAFVVANSTIEAQDVITYLMKSLPHYMIPKTITQIDEMPLTPNGKINRKSPILKATYQVSKNQVLPRNDTEKLLYNLFKETVNLDIGVTDNIFEHGVDSLMIIKLVSKLYLYNINLSIQDFYNNPSIEAISKLICEHTNKSDVPDSSSSKHIVKISDIQKPLYSELSYKKDGILLTGVTGFLGIHVLESLILHSDYKIYCSIRTKNGQASKSRLIDRLNYYFDGKYIDLIDKRIFVVDSNITDKYFGLTLDNYNKLGKKIFSVIHCAADVRHYGNYSSSEKINITATKNIIQFCLDFNAVLNHISTMTVSGYGLVDVNYTGIYDEDKFYIGQNYADNIYVKTKFLAEEEIFKALNKGLLANIYRIGNLTNRFSDYKFQFNSYENGFINKLKSIKHIRLLPESLKDYQLELTPVDLCSEAIVKLAISYKKKYNVNVFHLYNNNYISMNMITNILTYYNLNVKFVPDDEFEKAVASSIVTSEESAGFIEQFNIKNVLGTNQFAFSNEKTLSILKSLDFGWKNITEDYLKFLIKGL